MIIFFIVGTGIENVACCFCEGLEEAITNGISFEAFTAARNMPYVKEFVIGLSSTVLSLLRFLRERMLGEAPTRKLLNFVVIIDISFGPGKDNKPSHVYFNFAE